MRMILRGLVVLGTRVGFASHDDLCTLNLVHNSTYLELRDSVRLWNKVLTIQLYMPHVAPLPIAARSGIIFLKVIARHDCAIIDSCLSALRILPRIGKSGNSALLLECALLYLLCSNETIGKHLTVTDCKKLCRPSDLVCTTKLRKRIARIELVLRTYH
jgi:hypothetical protein